MGTVPLIEDDDRIRLSLTVALEDEGCAAHAVATAEEGLALQRLKFADRVLVDRVLPRIDEIEGICGLRQVDDAHIVVVSVRDDTHDVVVGLEAGAHDCFITPVAVKELQ